MRTARRFDRDRHRAGGAIFRDWRLAWFRRLHPVERADHQENCERDDEEVDDKRDEVAVVPGHCAGFHRIRDVREGISAILTGFEDDELIREIKPAGERADRRHNDVFDEGTDDPAEGRADDHAHREIESIALNGKLFEFLEHAAALLVRDDIDTFIGYDYDLANSL